MRLIDADTLSAFVGDLRSTLHKEQSTFKAMTEIEFNTRDYMLLNFQYTIDNAPTVDVEQIKSELNPTVTCWYDFDRGYEKGYEKAKKELEERPQGEWQLHGMIYYCSECGHECGESGDNFCGNCGADMRGAESE